MIAQIFAHLLCLYNVSSYPILQQVLKTKARMEALAKDRDRVEAYLNSVDLKMALEGQEMKTQLETTWPYFKLRGELKTVLDVSDVYVSIIFTS